MRYVNSVSILVFGLLFVISVQAQVPTIYTSNDSKEQELLESCTYYDGQVNNNARISYAAHKAGYKSLIENGNETFNSTNTNNIVRSSEWFDWSAHDDDNCTFTYSWGYKEIRTIIVPGQPNPSPIITNPEYGPFTMNGFKQQQLSCPPIDNPSYYLPARSDRGNGLRCFDPVDLAFRDSCPSGDLTTFLPAQDQDSPYVCVEKPDQSLCKYKLTEDAQYYEVDPEDTACYDIDPIPYDDDGLTVPTNGEETVCYDIGNGIAGCVEDPAIYCPNGACAEGCGYFGLGDQQPAFLCFSDDTDGDGLADYVDPDIDGDGIHNDEDLDADGDGQDDPLTPNGGGNSINIDLSRLEALQSDTTKAINEINDRLDIDTVDKGAYPDEETLNAEIDLITQELEAKITEIQTEFSSLFTTPEVTGSFSGCYDIASVNGTTSNTCIDNFSDEVSIIGIGMLFFFGFLSIWIVFK